MNIAINGFGRIGRLALRALLSKYPSSPVMAVNTSGSMDIEGWAMLFKYDSTYGIFEKEVTVIKSANEKEIGSLRIGDITIPFLGIRNPEEIPWKDYHAELILESTGVFLKRDQAEKHFIGGAKKVILSAPAKSDDIKLIMKRFNEQDATGESIISNCSCTTYSSAPVIKTILDSFGIEKMSLTTIHAYTSDQRLIDGSHKDPRRARAAAQNMIPTSSGSAEAIIRLLPILQGKFESSAIRVPVMTGSLSDHTFVLSKSTTSDEVNKILTHAAENEFKNILSVTSDPIVSSDIVGNDASAIVDLSLTSVIDGNMLKVYSWYDNEWSYALRLVEMAVYLE